MYATSARSAPRSDPANYHEFRSRAKPRRVRSAALFVRQVLPSSSKRVNASERVSASSIALGTSARRESLARSARGGVGVADCRFLCRR
jgi:hypothetical protein